MASEWYSNRETLERVATLLQQGGVPLELEAAKVCQDFCEADTIRGQNPPLAEGTICSAEKIIYSPEGSEQEYREIDQNVHVYSEIPVSDLTGVQLILNIPIECKYRANIEYFAFPLPDKSGHMGFPFSSVFAGSLYFRSLRGTYDQLAILNNSNILPIEIEGGRTPRGFHKENIVYNAAGALYDFVIFDLMTDIEVYSKDNTILDKIGIFNAFQDYLKKTHYGWVPTFRDWMKSIDNEKCEQFNRLYFRGHRIFHGMSAYLPIICVNGPIYRVIWDHSDGISGFNEIQFCLSSIRKHGWPGPARFTLLSRSAEVPIIVTNITGLKIVLEIALKWFLSIKTALINASPELIQRWALEASFFRRVAKHYTEQYGERYRSDLSVDQWF